VVGLPDTDETTKENKELRKAYITKQIADEFAPTKVAWEQ